MQLPATERSYWQTSASADYPTLSKNRETDVVIVGGGVAGLTAAYLIKQSGLNVIVLEKNTIGSGTTSHTTGKLTSQHGLIYAQLESRLGNKVAQTYATANQTAVQEISKIIRKEKIDCDFEVDDNFVYTTDPDKLKQFKREAKIAAALGLPATFETHTQLPFEIRGAVKFAGQAKLNAQKYVNALAALVQGGGSAVFERSEATRIRDGSPALVKVGEFSITAKHIILATKIPPAPLLARAGYALLEHPHTSYIVAGRPAHPLSGMYISPDDGHYSILPIRRGKHTLLLVGGEHHTPGLRNPAPRYRRLADYAAHYFGVSDIDYKWKGMDYLAYDDLPLVGRLYPWSKHLYVASGFKKWGLSTSFVAGSILRDLVHGQPNSWAEVFDSTRAGPILSIPHAIKNH